MTHRRRAGIAILSLGLTASTQAAFDGSTMYSVGDLAPFTNLVATKDVASTTFNFPFDSGQFTNSGFVRNILDSSGNPVLDSNTGEPLVVDRAELRTDVFRVTQQTQLAPGGLTLDVGDMVFAYTIRLVSASGNTVSTMDEFQVAGVSFIGTDLLDASLIKGRGFLTPGAGVGAPQASATPSTIDDFGPFGAQVEWNWSADPTQQLDNDQTITILMFTDQASIGDGVANLLAPLSTSTGPFDPTLEGAPVFIPITFIPTPGAACLLALAGVIAPRRRR